MWKKFITYTIKYQNSLRRYSSSVVRVRFAPSPTGFLHLGGLRTALYNYLFAKAQNGKFILRIEDTDQTRLVEGATEQLQDDLIWSGIEINEGPNIGGDFGPYVQSQRIELYREQVETLLDNGSAYYCFCNDKRLDLLRREAVRSRQVPKYDNRCRHFSKEEISKRLDRGEKHCIRFKLLSGCETFEDLIYGNIAYDVALNEGDPVIIKSDGFPTYHFANVVDDHFMQISHVFRGVEWQISTTKHILMYRAFNWEPPCYGHLPLLMNPDGSKLSKRQGDIKISHYKENGIFPLAVINFITNSGGGFQKDLERGTKLKIYTMPQLAEQFDINLINSHSGKLMQEKLLDFNRLEIERQLKCKQDEQKLVANVKKLIKNQFSDRPDDLLQLDENYIKTILNWSVYRINKLGDLLSKDLAFLWIVPRTNEKLSSGQLNAIKQLSMVLKKHDMGTKEELNDLLKCFAKDHDISFTQLMKLLRKVLSGLHEGPSVAEMMEILGKENTLRRLDFYVKQNIS